MDRFARITAFVWVAESGGFSAAGRRLNLSKAAVSDQVQALENALGMRLLNRTTRRVSLTEIGRDYYERGVQPCRTWRRRTRLPPRNRQPHAASCAYVPTKASGGSTRPTAPSRWHGLRENPKETNYCAPVPGKLLAPVTPC